MRLMPENVPVQLVLFPCVHMAELYPSSWTRSEQRWRRTAAVYLSGQTLRTCVNAESLTLLGAAGLARPMGCDHPWGALNSRNGAELPA